MLSGKDLHQSLKSEIIDSGSSGGVEFLVAKLQWSKDDIGFSIHASPNSFSTAGYQLTDFLSILGFTRSRCSFVGRQECYARWVSSDFKLASLLDVFGTSYNTLIDGERHLANCGYSLDQPEGWGYFFGKSSGGDQRPSYRGDGHTSAIAPKLMKQVEDEVFQFIFTWIKNGEADKGWTIHYRPKHALLSSELESVLEFLKIRVFAQCPQFDFEPCHWRHIQFEEQRDKVINFFNSNAHVAHAWFDAHKDHFSAGVRDLLVSQAQMEKVGLGFLPFRESSVRRDLDINRRILPATLSPVKSPGIPPGRSSDIAAQSPGVATNHATYSPSPMPTQFDVAVSFAGTERSSAETLSIKVREAGFSVFYDDFYEEDLWGKDLAEFFHEIYSKRARLCVIFISDEYNKHAWTVHERRSAQERMIKEKGNEYILPIKVDNTELPGLPTTIGYMPLSRGIENISTILVKKLRKLKKC